MTNTNEIKNPPVENMKFVRIVMTEDFGLCVTFKEYGKKNQSLWTLVSYLESNGSVWIVVRNPSKKRSRKVTFTSSNGCFF